MMYGMKKVITYDDDIPLPKCMYHIKPIFTLDDPTKLSDEEINIRKQVIKFLQAPRTEMAELEERQDQLLQKLDLLYDRIKSLSSSCQVKNIQSSKLKGSSPPLIATPDEIVLTASAENLPWYINIILKKISSPINIFWHIHSSVPTQKVPKIKAFVSNLPMTGTPCKVNVRLIFMNDSVDTALKLSSLDIPIVGNVNILRYLSFIYPNNVPYNNEDNTVDALLDICHKLERTNEKNKEAVVENLFVQYDGWIYNSSFSIVDVAAFNIIKQWRNCPKFVPKEWFDRISNLL